LLKGAEGEPIAPSVRGANPTFLTITGRSDVPPAGTTLKSTDRGFTSIFGTIPTPLRVTVTVGSTKPSEGMVKLELKDPAAVGANLTVTVQLPPGERTWLSAQVPPVLLKGAEAEPITPSVRGANPAFFTITG
jgi:hypothetical protein